MVGVLSPEPLNPSEPGTLEGIHVLLPVGQDDFNQVLQSMFAHRACVCVRVCVFICVLNFPNIKLNYCRASAFQVTHTPPFPYSPPLLVMMLGLPGSPWAAAQGVPCSHGHQRLREPCCRPCGPAHSRAWRPPPAPVNPVLQLNKPPGDVRH